MPRIPQVTFAYSELDRKLYEHPVRCGGGARAGAGQRREGEFPQMVMD